MSNDFPTRLVGHDGRLLIELTVKTQKSALTRMYNIQCTPDITTSQGTGKIMSDIAKIVISGVSP